MLILEYISTHGPTSGALHEYQSGTPRVVYLVCEQPSTSTRGERNPLQLAEHSSDAAGIVPAIADVCGVLKRFSVRIWYPRIE